MNNFRIRHVVGKASQDPEFGLYSLYGIVQSREILDLLEKE